MKLPALALLFATLACPGPAGADIYGYVDENGVAHLASYPVDSRYFLFKKEPGPTPQREDSAREAGDAAGSGRQARFSLADRKHYSPLISAVAKEHRLEAALLHAVITVESGYNPKARSPKGAIGLMQLMPETAERYSVSDIWDPRENLRGGARYLRDLLMLFGDDLTLALAAYNAGEGAVQQHGNRIPPYPETRSYVPRVLHQYQLMGGR